MGCGNALSLLSLSMLALAGISQAETTSLLDAIVVGGGPAGLSALSGLARVRRNAVLIDSGEYRNNATRHAHDLIGLDGVTPAYLRWLAREKLSYYDTVSMRNGTVSSIEVNDGNSSNPTFTATVVSETGEEKSYLARSVVLATGLRDIIPNTPGLQENWGKGIYWCPWCDGHEHADQSMGLLSSLEDVPGLVREVITLNSDVVAFVNGTDTPAARTATDASFADWEEFLEISNVTIYNQTITSITRLRDGYNASASGSEPTYPEYDLFRIDLDDGTSVERATFFTSFDDTQASSLGEDMGVALQGGRLAGIQSSGYLTNVPMVYAVGDNNVDNVTNIPHAMYSGKKAAVYLHVALAKKDVAARLEAAEGSANSSSVARRENHDLDPRSVWEVMNSPRGDMLHAGEFDDVF